MLYSEFVQYVKSVKHNEELLNNYKKIIDNIILEEDKKKKAYSQQKYSVKGFNRGSKYNYKKNQSNSKYQYKSSKFRNNNSSSTNNVVKKIIRNSDKMIINFNKLTNKLTSSNYDSIYKEVVSYFTSYISNIITDYIESYVKFGINGKCRIENLKLDLINEKYIYYQIKLWELLIQKYLIIGNNNIIYYNFINKLCSWNTKLFNETLIENIKSIFKLYCQHNYDQIYLGEINDEDPKQFFSKYITNISEKDKLIYNKITEIVEIFNSYNFSLTKIKYYNQELNIELIKYIENKENSEYFSNFIDNYITEFNSKINGVKLGYILGFENYFIDFDKIDIKNNNILYLIIGMFSNEKFVQSLSIENKKQYFDKLTIIKSNVISFIKYKIMDILDIIKE